MSLAAAYNTVTLDPLLGWREHVESIAGKTGKTVIGYRHTFTLEGFLTATDAAGRKTNIDTLLAKLRQPGQTLTITQDSVAIRTFQASDVLGSAPNPSYEIPAAHDLKLGFQIPVFLTITGETDPTGAVGGTASHTWTDSVEYDAQKRMTFTRRGQLRTVSGTTASSKFEGTDPQSSLPTSTASGDWKLSRKIRETDEDERLLTYTWVYVDEHVAMPAGVIDADFSLNGRATNGTEVWTGSGTLRFEAGVAVNKKKVRDTLTAAGMPSGVVLAEEDITVDLRENTVQFSVSGTRAYGTGGILEHEETVETDLVENTRDFLALDSGGDDVRQFLTRPQLTIRQEVRQVREGQNPDVPSALISDAEARIQRTTRLGRKTYGIDGKLASVERTTIFVFRPLNLVDAGQDPKEYEPGKSPLEGAKPNGFGSV